MALLKAFNHKTCKTSTFGRVQENTNARPKHAGLTPVVFLHPRSKYGGLARHISSAESLRLRRMLGEVKIFAGAVLAYGGKKISASTTQMAQGPQGFGDFCNYSRQKQRFNRGFTMVEMLVVVGLIALITALGLSMSMDSYRRFSFRNDRDAAVAALQRARAQAINNVCLGAACSDGKRHGVYFDNTAHQMVIFQGDNYVTRETAVDEIIKFESSTTQVNPVAEVVFDQLSGSNHSGGSTPVNMNNSAGQTAALSVNSVGRIDF